MKRLAQISIVSLAALAVWLASPRSDGPSRDPGAAAREPARPAPGEAGTGSPGRVLPPATSPFAGPVESSAGGDGRGGAADARGEAAADASGLAEARALQARVGRLLQEAGAPASAGRAGGGRPGGAAAGAGEPPPTPALAVSGVPASEPAGTAAPPADEGADGALPPGQRAEPREQVRARIDEEQELLEQLARQSAGEGASEREIRDRSDLIRTLLSAEDAETRERVLQRAARGSDTGR